MRQGNRIVPISRKDARLFPHFEPVRKRLWVESTDGHYTGFAIFELSPAGLRWWWEGDDQEVVTISSSAIVQSSILDAIATMEEDVALALARLERVKKRVMAIERLRSWKLIHTDTDVSPFGRDYG